jgi:hypothetical protein
LEDIEENAMDPNDPLQRDEWRQNIARDDDARAANATWGWVAAAVFVAVVLFIAFSSGRNGTQTASNDTMTSARTMTPPAYRAPADSAAPATEPAR